MATYTLGCFTKHWNNYNVLLIGRLFCGVATSLLYSAFESWLVAEHFKVGPAAWPLQPPLWLCSEYYPVTPVMHGWSLHAAPHKSGWSWMNSVLWLTDIML